MINFGVLLPSQVPAGSAFDQNFLKDIATLAKASREAGADAIFGLQHFGSSMQTLQPWPMLSWLSGSLGDGVGVGTCISLLPTQNPLQVAEEVATIDHLTRGRMFLGVGAGYREPELGAFGVTLASRGGRMEEAVYLLRSLWRGEMITAPGRYWNLEGMSIGIEPHTNGGPPIWLGAQSKPAISRAARIGDAWIAPANSPDETWLPFAQSLYLDELRKNGKIPEAVRHPVLLEYCASDNAEVIEFAFESLRREYLDYAAHGALSWFDSRFDEMKRSFAIGSVAEIGEKLSALVDLGFDYFILRPKWSRFPVEEAAESLETFGHQYSSLGD